MAVVLATVPVAASSPTDAIVETTIVGNHGLDDGREEAGSSRQDANRHESSFREESEDDVWLQRPASMEEICATLSSVAAAHDLPLPFFARLIWQESGFRPEAVSRAGARGIAQFMPGTAEWRGLADPHDPIAALHKSADYLRELRMQFGNLGLAAAAYNGGSGRVEAWLKGKGGLPRETRQYVQIVTGVPAEEWRDGENAAAVQSGRFPARLPCPVLVALGPGEEPLRASQPVRLAGAVVPAIGLRAPQASAWAVVLGGDFSIERVQARFARLKQRFSAILQDREPTIVTGRIPGRGRLPVSVVRIDEPDRASANRLCAQLRASGGSCLVLRAS